MKRMATVARVQPPERSKAPQLAAFSSAITHARPIVRGYSRRSRRTVAP